jgi:hypothetical protein
VREARQQQCFGDAADELRVSQEGERVRSGQDEETRDEWPHRCRSAARGAASRWPGR